MRKCFLLLFILASLINNNVQANNVKIQNVSIINNGPGNIRVQFDLSWDNSWRVNTGQSNYDGVWVFFKYRPMGSTGEWSHMDLMTGGDQAPAGCTINTMNYGPTLGNDRTGAMIYRSNPGAGTVSFAGIQVGVKPNLPYDIDVQGFAIEMVYIPEATNLFLGDGDGITESFNAFHLNASTGDNKTQNYYVYATNVNQSQLIHTDLNAFDDDYLNGENGKQLKVANKGLIENSTLLPDWPTFMALWSMKYEITQGAYRDFLNTLSLAQQINHIAASPSSARGTLAMVTSGTPVRANIKIDVPSAGSTPVVFGCDENGNGVFDEPADGEYAACGYLNWPDVAAYLSWSGLAPMTEFVYERICRGYSTAGANLAVLNEYAWGTNQLAATAMTVSNQGDANEIISNQTISAFRGYANAPSNTPAPGMPLRNGIFAANPGANRVVSGAGFFGVMELTGNIEEVCVTLGNSIGRLYNGHNGIGALDANGYSTGYTWPGFSNNVNETTAGVLPIKYSAGTILKGGSFSGSMDALRVSDRSAGQAESVTRNAWQGGRGVLYIY